MGVPPPLGQRDQRVLRYLSRLGDLVRKLTQDSTLCTVALTRVYCLKQEILDNILLSYDYPLRRAFIT